MSSFYNEEELKTLGLKSYGKNILISRNACIYGADKISLGDNVRIDDFCIISGNIQIGSYVHVAASTLLFGGTSGIILEDFVGVSSRSAIYAESDDYGGDFLTNPMVPDKYKNVSGGTVVLKKHALIGTGSTILPKVVIGEGCSVGSMSLITKDLDEWSIYIGIPCKKIKERSKNLLLLEEQFLKHHFTTFLK